MLSTEEMDALYRRAFSAFNDSEWTKLKEHYQLKNPLENTYAHLLVWSSDLEQWTKYLADPTLERPNRKLWEYLHPSEYEPNPLRLTLESAADAAVKYGYGRVPRIAIIPYLSRAFLRFIEELDNVYHSASLDNLKHSIKEYFKLLIHQGPREMTDTEFHAALKREFHLIIGSFHRYANELSVYINQQLREGRNTQPLPTPAPIVEKGFAVVSSAHAAIEKAVVKSAANLVKAVRKPRGKRAKFSVELQDEVYAIHLKAKNNAEVKKNSKTSTSKEAEFAYLKKRLAELGIVDANAYEAVLKARSNRIYNGKRKIRRSSSK